MIIITCSAVWPLVSAGLVWISSTITLCCASKIILLSWQLPCILTSWIFLPLYKVLKLTFLVLWSLDVMFYTMKGSLSISESDSGSTTQCQFRKLRAIYHKLNGREQIVAMLCYITQIWSTLDVQKCSCLGIGVWLLKRKGWPMPMSIQISILSVQSARQLFRICWTPACDKGDLEAKEILVSNTMAKVLKVKKQWDTLPCPTLSHINLVKDRDQICVPENLKNKRLVDHLLGPVQCETSTVIYYLQDRQSA